MKKKWWIIIIIVLIAGLGYVGFNVYQGMSGQNAAVVGELTEQDTVVVTRQTLQITVDGSGSLAPNDDVSVSFSAGGKVVEVLVDVGDAVQAGDILARLDDADARETMADADLQVQQAEINLELAKLEAEAGLNNANLAAAQTDLERVQTNDAHVYDQLTSARIQVQQAKEDLVDAEEAWDDAWDPGRDWELNIRGRKEQLEQERDSTEKNLQRAKDSLENAQANYNLAVIGIDKSAVQDAEIQVANAQITLDKEPIQLEQTALSLEQAKLKLVAAQRSLDDMVLVAPMDGTITELNIKPGQLASNGQTAVVISDLVSLVVEIGLDETDIAQVVLGQEALITLDAFDEVVLNGLITEIAPIATIQSGVVMYDVTVRLVPTDLPIKPGMTADVEIIANSAEDVLVVPIKAIRSIGNGSLVMRKLYEGEQAPEMSTGSIRPGGSGQGEGQMQEGGPRGDMSQAELKALREQMQADMQSQLVEGYTPVRVTLGLMTDANVEILSGLNEGDVVLVNTSTVSDSQFDGPQGMGFMMGRRP